MTNALRIPDHPAHRLRHLGPAALSTPELLAIVIGQPDALTRAGKLLAAARGSLRQLAQTERGTVARFHDLTLTDAQHARVNAALELGRRLAAEATEEGAPVRSPRDVARLFAPRLEDLQIEEFHVAVLDAQHRLKVDVTVTTGTLTSSLVHPREVFARAIVERAAAIILVHNHPSGDPSPSADDRVVTEQLVAAGKLLDIPVHDHIIIGRGRYTSFAEAGLI
jgi:DNA repair protein RadC